MSFKFNQNSSDRNSVIHRQTMESNAKAERHFVTFTEKPIHYMQIAGKNSVDKAKVSTHPTYMPNIFHLQGVERFC
jgi:hypothetical protein